MGNVSYENILLKPFNLACLIQINFQNIVSAWTYIVFDN